MSDQPKDIGYSLKKEREAKGIPLEMVHEATKIPIDSLKAIEEGYKVRTLTSFYYKSFVRIYAQYLNLDPEPILAKISSVPVRKRIEPHPTDPVSKKIKETAALNLFARPIHARSSKKILKAALVLFAVIAAIALLVGLVRLVRSAMPATTPSDVKTGKKLEKKAEKIEKKEKMPLAPVALETKKAEDKKTGSASSPEASGSAEAAKSARAAEPAKKTENVKASESTKKVETAKAIEKPSKAASTSTEKKPAASSESNTIAAKAVKKVSVSVRAVNSSWLTVRADGAPVFQGVLKKGTSDSWSAAKTIDISGRDIDQLEFEVNGKPIGRLSRRGAPVKKIRITPEGLTVEK